MTRVNLTLDKDTFGLLQRHARRERVPSATAARQLIREALSRRQEDERRKKLAADYAAGSGDDRELLSKLESLQIEVIGDEET
ncbi:MAG: hypothetical protein ACT4TC_03490 [Myxococcaceae bacterium]